MSDRRYDGPPRNRRALEQRLRNVIPDTDLQQRARRQLGYIALAAALTHHARDEHDEPLFPIKGGVAIELLLGLRARATKDLDAAARLAGEDIAPRLRAALAHGWEGFAFRLIGLEQVRDTAAHRGDVKVSYQGDPWSTVQFEVSTGVESGLCPRMRSRFGVSLLCLRRLRCAADCRPSRLAVAGLRGLGKSSPSARYMLAVL